MEVHFHTILTSALDYTEVKECPMIWWLKLQGKDHIQLIKNQHGKNMRLPTVQALTPTSKEAAKHDWAT
jgi:hypothetical protein